MKIPCKTKRTIVLIFNNLRGKGVVFLQSTHMNIADNLSSFPRHLMTLKPSLLCSLKSRIKFSLIFLPRAEVFVSLPAFLLSREVLL